MKTTYLRQLETIAQKVEKISVTNDETWYRRYAVFSTNLGLMMPQIPVANHVELFKQTVRNQCWAKEEESHVSAIDYLMHDEVTEAIVGLRRQPAVICTFHTGSYRLLGHVLARMGVPFALLVASDIASNQGHAFRESFKTQGYSNMPAFDIIDAESPASALKMMRCLRSGVSLLTYADGNTGAGSRQTNTVPVSFMEGTLHVRQGLPWLALKARVPLLTIHCLRGETGRILFKMGKGPLEFPPDSIELASARAMQYIYSDLAAQIADSPWQWENWLYLHRFILT